MRYYIEDQSQPNGFIEVSENEYKDLFGDNEIHPYVQAVYRGEIAINDVPTEHQEVVQTIVSNRVSRWGEFNDSDISDAEFRALVEEAL